MAALCLSIITGLVWSQIMAAGTPEDADALCTGGEYQEPHPINVVPLMDSHQYLVLLGSGAVWQQVDLDSNNMRGTGTEVSQL